MKQRLEELYWADYYRIHTPSDPGVTWDRSMNASQILDLQSKCKHERWVDSQLFYEGYFNGAGFPLCVHVLHCQRCGKSKAVSVDMVDVDGTLKFPPKKSIGSGEWAPSLSEAFSVRRSNEANDQEDPVLVCGG